MERILLILASWFLVAFGQPAWFSACSFLAASVGYALFWWSLRDSRFWIATLWFATAQIVQLSWMSQIEYMGLPFLFVYGAIVLWLGMQFGLLTHFLLRGPITLSRSLGMAGIWVFFEWTRLFLCTGFTWNPVGIALSASIYSLQAASLLGIYGLSFWVMFTNLVVLRAFIERTQRAALLACGIALLPFAFGFARLSLHSQHSRPGEPLSALLVQTNLLPCERDFAPYQSPHWIPPVLQWKRLFFLIEQQAKTKSPELIVLPESAVPFTAFSAAYSLPSIQNIWQETFGSDSLRDLPTLEEKSARKIGGQWFVSNAFLFQALANHYGSELIVGMDDRELPERYYNAAFHFMPRQDRISRTEKRVLVPIAEYLPLRSWQWLMHWIGHRYGITGSFEAGREAKVIRSKKAQLGICICYEETFSGLVGEFLDKGATLLVTISNDGYYPFSRLPKQHFDHGVLRAVENGVPLIRACTTGITGGVDCFGRSLALLPPHEAGALWVDVPLQTTRTLYSILGDQAILILSAVAILGLFIKQRSSTFFPDERMT